MAVQVLDQRIVIGPQLLRLTDYETRTLVLVQATAIISCRPLKAETIASMGVELGARTRIDTARDTFLVLEKPEEIEAMTKPMLTPTEQAAEACDRR